MSVLSYFDQFGYYVVGQTKTYSKLEAILEHGKTGIHPEWKFNEPVFSTYDWKTEPKESLQDLYKQRAEQIRSRYDYIVLFYSGGADSTNVLQTFIQNNIKLDEIAQFCSLEGDNGNKQSNFNSEVFNVAIPWSQKIIEKYPYIKHRVIDQTKLINDIYLDPAIKLDFLYQQNVSLSPNNFSRAYLRKFVKDYADMIAEGKKLCFIWGAEKPCLHLINDKYCLRFQDLFDNSVSPIIQQNAFEGWYDELFYWSPDFVKGMCKQAHIVKKALRTFPTTYPYFSKEHSTHGITKRVDGDWFLTADGLHLLIYPGWDITTFSVGKKRSFVLSLRDRWYFQNGNNENCSAKFFLSGINSLDKILDNNLNGYWKNKSNIMGGIKNCLSSPYFLE